MPTLNSVTGAKHARILSVGSYRPKRVVTNAEVWFDSPESAEAAGFTLANTHPNS